MKRRVVELESWVRKREMDKRVTKRQRERERMERWKILWNHWKKEKRVPFYKNVC